jgi:threonine/homoserine/homoserine lactone efflux protein
MDTQLFLIFVGISTAVIVIPGPSVLLIVSNSLRFGLRAGLFTAGGISAAMILQLAVAVAGMTSLLLLRTDWFTVLRWIGIAYLGYLGFTRLLRAEAAGSAGFPATKHSGSSLAQGFLVSLTNPTTMTFFIAFFPQFLAVERAPVPQFLEMSVTFWVLALLFDVGYALLTARLGRPLQTSRWVRLRNRLSGAIMLAAALGLALAR